ncbi:MAG TPA: HAD family hydrolase [Ktedonobacterales bacterium]
MTDIRLLAVDLDGTLLDPSGALTLRTRAAVAAAAARGVRIVLATARRYTGALPVARALGCVDALLLYDGAQARAFPSGANLFAQVLPAAVAQRAAELMAARHLQPIAQHAPQVGEYLLVAPAAPRGAWASAYLASAGQQVRQVPLAQLCAGHPDPQRVVAFGPLPRLRALARDLAGELPVDDAVRAEPPPDPLTAQIAMQLLPAGNYGTAELTVFAPGASKGAALAWLAARYNIPLAQTMAIGDGMNDVSLLQTAGLAVAMGTAPRALRRVADALTESNAEDGAARAIERYILARDPARARAATAPGAGLPPAQPAAAAE